MLDDVKGDERIDAAWLQGRGEYVPFDELDPLGVFVGLALPLDRLDVKSLPTIRSENTLSNTDPVP